MGWARFDDNYSDHPKIADLSLGAEMLDVRAVIYCARYDTDGLILRPALKRISRKIPKPLAKVDELVIAGRWESHKDGWVVHDFLKYNPSKAQQERAREMGKERSQRWRDGVTNASRNGGGEGEPKKERVFNERCKRCGGMTGIDCECPDLRAVSDHQEAG